MTVASISAVAELFAAAAELTALPAWQTAIGGRPVTLRFTDERFGQEMARRFHAASPAAAETPWLTLDFLELDALGWANPAQWDIWELDRTLLIPLLSEHGIAGLLPDHRPDHEFPFMFFDATAAHGVVLTQRTATVPPYVSGAPFAFLIHLALAASGSRLLHAGTVGTAGVGALIVGDEGAGKSATTLAGVCAGLATVGDDFVAVDLEPEPTAFAVYSKFKQTPAGIERFPAVARRVRHLPLNWRGKYEFDAELVATGCLHDSLPLRLILLPEVVGAARTTAHRVPPTEAFSAISQSLLPYLPGATLSGFRMLTRLTRAVPALRLQLSSDPDEIGDALTELLRHA